ncbi:hypothetical protein J6590_029655 [Homalodisca vitripennis]|nr:hypothetical protein J6590_029655 [Homalodisca vitripennis]
MVVLELCTRIVFVHLKSPRWKDLSRPHNSACVSQQCTVEYNETQPEAGIGRWSAIKHRAWTRNNRQLWRTKCEQLRVHVGTIVTLARSSFRYCELVRTVVSLMLNVTAVLHTGRNIRKTYHERYKVPKLGNFIGIAKRLGGSAWIKPIVVHRSQMLIQFVLWENKAHDVSRAILRTAPINRYKSIIFKSNRELNAINCECEGRVRARPPGSLRMPGVSALRSGLSHKLGRVAVPTAHVSYRLGAWRTRSDAYRFSKVRHYRVSQGSVLGPLLVYLRIVP